jgi:hypothetical protein
MTAGHSGCVLVVYRHGACGVIVAVALTALLARQMLMPTSNAATMPGCGNVSNSSMAYRWSITLCHIHILPGWLLATIV